jgi:hypothetical protein
MSEEKTEETTQLPDQAFFDACAEGNEAYLRSVIESGMEFEWGRIFTFKYMFEGEEIEVWCSWISFAISFFFLH